jgi:hypothetical protein
MFLRITLIFSLLAGCATQPLPHRSAWEVDPQGHDKSHGYGQCEVGQVPYYVFTDAGRPVFLECMRATGN